MSRESWTMVRREEEDGVIRGRELLEKVQHEDRVKGVFPMTSWSYIYSRESLKDLGGGEGRRRKESTWVRRS